MFRWLCWFGKHKWVGDLPKERLEMFERMARGKPFLDNLHCKRCKIPMPDATATQ
jgi:hypothetical protein